MRVAFFVGCVNDVFFARAAVGAARILERLGVDVHFPQEQTCCGQAHFNSGQWAQAATLARHFVRTFESAEYVVAPTGSCVAMVREHYVSLLAGDPAVAPRARALAARTYEFAQFVTDVLGIEDLGARYPVTAAYHASCHASRILGAAEAPERLLRCVRELTLVPFEGADRCCGFGGTFAVKSPEVSVAMADDKLAAIEAAGADVVVSADGSCLLHLMGRARRRGLRLRFVHVAELLAEGMGLLDPSAGAEAARAGAVAQATTRPAGGGRS